MLSGVVLVHSHRSSTLCYGIVILFPTMYITVYIEVPFFYSCLLYQRPSNTVDGWNDEAEPDQQCDQWDRVVQPHNLHVHPQRGHLIGHLDGCSAPTRCYDAWPGMVCPTCRYNTRRSCFMRCRCPLRRLFCGQSLVYARYCRALHIRATTESI